MMNLQHVLVLALMTPFGIPDGVSEKVVTWSRPDDSSSAVVNIKCSDGAYRKFFVNPILSRSMLASNCDVGEARLWEYPDFKVTRKGGGRLSIAITSSEPGGVLGIDFLANKALTYSMLSGEMKISNSKTPIPQGYVQCPISRDNLGRPLVELERNGERKQFYLNLSDSPSNTWASMSNSNTEVPSEVVNFRLGSQNGAEVQAFCNKKHQLRESSVSVYDLGASEIFLDFGTGTFAYKPATGSEACQLFLDRFISDDLRISEKGELVILGTARSWMKFDFDATDDQVFKVRKIGSIESSEFVNMFGKATPLTSLIPLIEASSEGRLKFSLNK